MNPTEARSLFERLLRGIAPEVDLDGVDTAADLQDILELDSMDLLNLMTALAEQTGIDVPERDYPALASIDGFIAYVVAASERAVR